MQNLKTKIAIAFVLSFALVWVISQQIPGVAVNGPIVPMDSRDVYSTMDPWWAAGVFRDATNSSMLTNITAQRRLRGMLVYTSAETKYWRLSNDLVSWIDVSANFGGTATNNIYNQNGDLTSDRTLSGASYSLHMTGLTSLSGQAQAVDFYGTNSFDAHSAVTTIEGRQQFYLQTPSVFSNAKTNYVLKLLPDGGGVTGLADFLPDASIYDDNGTIGVARVVYIDQTTADPWSTGVTFYGSTNGGTMSGFFSAFGLGLVNLFARTNTFTATQEAAFGSGSRVKLITPANQYTTGTNGQVLTIVDGSKALVDFRPVTNLYTGNGTLTSDRVVDGTNRNFSIIGVAALTNLANSITHQATTKYTLKTPQVVAGSATAGQVLTLANVSGDVEYANLPSPPVPPVTLYSGDGTITGTRSVSVGNNSLGFTYGGAGAFQILNGNYFGLNMKTNALYGPDEISLNTTATTGRIKMGLPNVSASANGDVVTLIDKTTSRVEYRPLPAAPITLYSGDGSLSGNRTVTIGANTLTVTGTGQITNVAATFGVNASGSATIDSSAIKFRTPAVKNATAKVGQNLQLVNVDGTVEFYAAQNPATHIVVTNVAELLTVPTGTAGPFLTAETLGYYTSGDGGGGLYSTAVFLAAQTNYGNFKSSSDPTRMWKVIQSKDGVPIRQYGAKGDDTADDTLPFQDWLKAINGGVGLLNVGTYLIRPMTTVTNTWVSINGGSKFSTMAHKQIIGSDTGNCATLKRFGGSAADAAHLIQAGAGSSLSFFNVVFDGNKSVEATATAAYLLYSDQSPTEINGCVFRNSAGHGLNIASGATSFTQIQNCFFDTLNRGVRINTSAVVSMVNCRIYRCSEHGLTVAGNDFRGTDLFIQDIGQHGIQLAGAHRCHFQNVKIFHVFKSAVLFELTGQPPGWSCKFSDCVFMNSNTAANALGSSPYGAALYPTVHVNGTGNEYTIANSFVNCTFGDITGSYQGRSPQNFGWTAPTVLPRYAWEKWSFVGCQFMWNPSWATDFTPVLTNTVSELGSLRSNTEMNSVFGKSGAITSAGWRMDIVESGTTGGQNAVIYANNTSHKLLRDTAGYGTPVAREGPDPLPAATTPPADDPDRPGGPIKP